MALYTISMMLFGMFCMAICAYGVVRGADDREPFQANIQYPVQD